jgi:UDP-N-acetylmuramate dehydrogenase
MKILENQNLQKLNTFAVNASAKYYADIKSTKDLVELSASQIYSENIKFILGGGSNILFTKDIECLVIKNSILGIEIINESESEIILKVGSGEDWHKLVCYCVNKGYGGIENLSLIPGSVGAAPLQNIGAYGVELADIFHSLEAFHLNKLESHSFNKGNCNFGYRESIFKNKLAGQYIITSVTLKLNKNPKVNISYGNISDELNKLKIVKPSIKDVSNVVISIRERKLPDPKKIGNSGSFFKNPIISFSKFKSIERMYPNIAHYIIDDTNVKLAAGWLIDNAGWKGKTINNYGVHKNQALVLVNYGGASGKNINDLSNLIIKEIFDKYNVKLEKEVNVY